MKKFLGVSLVALMAVSTARADIASKQYVDAQIGNIASFDSATDVATAISNAITDAGGQTSTDVQNAITAAIGDLDATVSQSAGADGLALSVTEADGVVTAVSGSIAANTYDAYGAAQAVADKMVTVTSGEGYNKTSTTTYPSMATAAQIASEAASALAGDYATAAQGALADSAVQSVVAGDGNGQIKVDGTNINVTGLGTAAYEAATAFDAAGTAASLVGDRTGWETAYGTGVDTVSEAIAAVNTKAAGSVQSVALASGTNDGTVKLTVDGVDTDNIAVTGLGSAAYENANAFATAAQGALADTSLQKTTTVAADGQFVLTKKVINGVASYAWELITRTGNETAGATTGEQ